MVPLTDSFAYGELDAWIDKLKQQPFQLYVVLFPAPRSSLKATGVTVFREWIR